MDPLYGWRAERLNKQPILHIFPIHFRFFPYIKVGWGPLVIVVRVRADEPPDNHLWLKVSDCRKEFGRRLEQIGLNNLSIHPVFLQSGASKVD